MKTQVRPRTQVFPLLTDFHGSKPREIPVEPDGGFFSTRDFPSALKKAHNGTSIILPPGEYPAFELTKNLEIRAAHPGTVTFVGTMRISAGQAILRGLNLRGESSQPALISEKGLLVVDDCAVAGRIEAAGKTRLFIRNSLLGRANDAILLTHEASVEVLSSRITDCRIGVALREGTSAALYHCFIKGCTSTTDESDPGAAIFAEKASVYCEGVRFSANDVGTYFIENAGASLVASHLQASGVASLISTGGAAKTHVRACLIEGQTTDACAQFSLGGGRLKIAHTVLQPAPGSALMADQTQVEIFRSSFASEAAPAIDLRSCEITGTEVECSSSASAAFVATQCSGTLHNSTFSGPLPPDVSASPGLSVESAENKNSKPSASQDKQAEPLNTAIDDILAKLRKSVGQDAARHDLERLLRLAHASRQREPGAPLPTELHFHSVFMGAHGTGRLEAAQRLAEGLHALGIVPRPEVQEVQSFHTSDENQPREGVVFIRVRQASSSAQPEESALFLERLLAQSGTVVILAGDRDEIRRLLRSSIVLDRVFRRTLFFSTYGPVELATVFARHCERDHIPVGEEAAQALLLLFHLYSERKDKRFANTSGVKALYETTRQRYLERCGASGRRDLVLAPGDLEIPADKAVRNAIERCPAFVTFCPHCKGENPWLFALEQPFVCLHCDTPYSTGWGIWRDSATYRRMRESLHQTGTTAITARAAHLPSR